VRQPGLAGSWIHFDLMRYVRNRRATARRSGTAWLQRSMTEGTNMLRQLIVAMVVVLAPLPGRAVEVAPNGFLVRHELTINAPAAKVYESLLGKIGSWWSDEHTYSGDSRNLSIGSRPGGCFCERLPNGGVEHMRVVYLLRNRMVRMAGGLGPLQASGVSGSMTWRLTPIDVGTRLELTYSVGGFMPGGFESVAPAVDRVLGEQAERLKRFVETGAPSLTR
jgi:uncharacterized protein YndB with AHSA1/START domain